MNDCRRANGDKKTGLQAAQAFTILLIGQSDDRTAIRTQTILCGIAQAITGRGRIWGADSESFVRATSLEAKHIVKRINAFAAEQPASGLESAAGKAFAAAGGMTERDRVGSRIKADFVGCRDAFRPGWSCYRLGVDSPADASPRQAAEACRKARPSWSRGEFPTPTRRIRIRPSAVRPLSPPVGERLQRQLKN